MENEKNNQKSLITKLMEASKQIHKGKEYIPAGYVVYSPKPLFKPHHIFKVKEWLVLQRQVVDYGMNKEQELVSEMTKMMAEEIDKLIIEKTLKLESKVSLWKTKK